MCRSHRRSYQAPPNTWLQPTATPTVPSLRSAAAEPKR